LDKKKFIEEFQLYLAIKGERYSHRKLKFIVSSFFELMEKVLIENEENIKFSEFGVFSSYIRKPRDSYDPYNRQKVKIKMSRYPKFKFSKKLLTRFKKKRI
jgi:nucleoid DNA-binding protein